MITTLRRSITCLAAIATGILLAQSTPLRAAITPAENLLPADTLAFFTVPDTAAFRAACQDFAADHVLERRRDEAVSRQAHGQVQ
jgi:hypothetical protein